MMWSCFCALSYYYMVAAWGGYVFIINIIPIYTVIMMVGGRYSSRLYIAYSVFYTLGSLMAMTVPFVGNPPHPKTYILTLQNLQPTMYLLVYLCLLFHVMVVIIVAVVVVVVVVFVVVVVVVVVVVAIGFNVINQAECAASHGVFIAIQVFAVMTYVMSVVDVAVNNPFLHQNQSLNTISDHDIAPI